MQNHINRKNLATATMVGSLLLVSAQASAEGWYVSGNVGYSDPTSKAFDDGTNGPGTPKSEIDDDVRYGVAVGKAITPFLKIELAYSLASYDTDLKRTSGMGARSPDSIGIDAKLDVDLLTMNVAYEFKNSSQFTPYIKAGVGTTFYDIDGDLYVSSFGGDTFGGDLPGVSLLGSGRGHNRP